MKSKPLAADTLWTTELVKAEKQKIKSELSRLGAHPDPKNTLDQILGEIHKLENDDSSLGLLRRFLYVLSALFQHAEHGGLSQKTIKELFGLGSSILRVQRISPPLSRLSFLYGDLHFAISQIHSRKGHQWLSAWEQHLAMQLSRRTSLGGKGFEALAKGIRALRLGHTGLATQYLEEAEREGLLPQYIPRARLERMKAYRLMGVLAQADEVAISTQGQLPDWKQDEQKEFHWENLCRQTQRTQNIGLLIQAVQKGKPHHDYAYILEAFLWSRVVSSKEWLQRFPSAKSLARSSTLNPKRLGFTYESVRTVERAYDENLPFQIRLETLGNIISKTSILPTIEREILVWAATIRWLVRSQSFELANLTLKEFQAINLRLSEGKNVDVLGSFAEMKNRSWLRIPTPPVQKINSTKAVA